MPTRARIATQSSVDRLHGSILFFNLAYWVLLVVMPRACKGFTQVHSWKDLVRKELMVEFCPPIVAGESAH